jgi:hypothetical protein
MAEPEGTPVPPSDFATRELPIDRVPAGERFTRIHHRDFGALYFGTTGVNRFDDPERQYGACYLSRSLEGAFAETCLRGTGATFLSRGYLADRVVTTVEAAIDLRLVALHGAGLARAGATSAVRSGDYRVAQIWSAAIHAHSAAVDGIAYRANHDDGEISIALFDRCQHQLELVGTVGLMEDRSRLGSLLDRYRVGLG